MWTIYLNGSRLFRQDERSGVFASSALQFVIFRSRRLTFFAWKGGRLFLQRICSQRTRRPIAVGSAAGAALLSAYPRHVPISEGVGMNDAMSGESGADIKLAEAFVLSVEIEREPMSFQGSAREVDW